MTSPARHEGEPAVPVGDADLIIRNARVTDGAMWPAEHAAVAVRDGRILAVGGDEEVGLLQGPDTVVVDADRRRVVPGLVDGHLHVVRTGLSYETATSWSGVRSLAEGLDRLAAAHAEQPAGSWVYVPGGWTEDQLGGDPGPTREDLDRVCGERPAYVQCAYQYAVLNTAGLQAAGLLDGVDHFPAGSVQVDEDGRATGRVSGLTAYSKIVDGLVNAPSLASQSAGTQRFVQRLTSLGLVGALDPGGFRTTPESYLAVKHLNQTDQLRFRLRLYVHAATPGDEVAETTQWVRHAGHGSQDPWLRVVGLGEVLSHDTHDSSGYQDFPFTDEARRKLREITELAAAYGFAVHAHAIRDESIGEVIDAWEELEDTSVVGRLRFSIAHGELIGERNLQRLKALGAGIGIQCRMLDTAVTAARAWGDETFEQAAPLGRIRELGLPLSGGTDGAVGHTYNPWEALWWFTTGRPLGDAPVRAEEHRLSRADALVAYTEGSAWFSFEEHERGRLEPGWVGDLAILDRDYFEVPDDELPEITAWMTVIGGEIVHRAD